ncbi:MAG: VIT1/CCC1 transporter family protein, partial [Verrucomicrobiae bacterium]|nr:VIT1/CCC1 transporter family protein [Verrucomicrobiae bacterium]
MPATQHIEKHFHASQSVRDVIIGMADGLTVPFALAAGLSVGLVKEETARTIIITAGFAEIAAGAIAMGLGGYLAGKNDVEHYNSELLRENDEIIEKPDAEKRECAEILEEWGLEEDEARHVVEKLSQRPKQWVDFMMRFELGLEKPDANRALWSAMTIGGAYIVGGLIPLSPYLALHNMTQALIWSIGITLIALLFFGFIKGKLAGVKPVRSAFHTMLVGGLAAAAAFGIAKLIG